MASQLDALAAEIVQEAQDEAAKILREGEDEAKRIVDEAEAQLKAETEAIIGQARKEADAVARRFLSEAKHKARLTRLASLNGLMDEVLNRARKKVADALSENDARQKMILTMIGEALAEIEDENVKIGISKTTAEAVNFARLKSEASKLSKGKLDWRVSEEVDPDGVVVESTDAKRRVLNTISSRFERLDSQILTQVKQRLFAETR